MLSVDNHCLIRNKQSEKMIRFVARESVFSLPDAEIVVIWKGKAVRMPANRIGDGMLVPMVYERALIAHIDWHWLTQGLSIYQEYDEEYDEWKTFLWKYPGGAEGIEVLNTLSKHFSLGWTVAKEGKFVAVHGCGSLRWDEQSLSMEQAVSFLLGLCLGYGSPKNKSDQTITTWQVNLPCLGEIMRHESLLKRVIEVCNEHGLFWIHSDVKQRDLTVWNWTIHDAELIAYLRAFWTDGWPIAIGKSTSEQIVVDYLEANGVKCDYVLKFVGK